MKKNVEGFDGSVQRPARNELEKSIKYLLDHVKDDEAVYAAWIILNRAYNRQ